MKVVVDASVAIKWFFRTREGEANVAQALELLRGVGDGRVTLLQPPHFLAEVGAVLARESPKTAQVNLRDLLDIEMQVVDGDAIYARAIAMAMRLGQHVFDTLYHALALETADAVLVTADDGYARKARSAGAIVQLADFR